MKKRILIVDDNEDAASTLGMLLEAEGNEVRLSHGGEEALSLADHYAPQVVLLDLGMPGLSGYDVCQRLRALPAGNDMHIVAVTGWGQEEARRRTTECGFDAHLVKPVGVTSMMRALREIQSAETGQVAKVTV